MTSKDIISRLIDDHLITGEEAYVLMNDTLRGEMTKLLENMNGWSLKEPSIINNIQWHTATPYICDINTVTTGNTLNTKK